MADTENKVPSYSSRDEIPEQYTWNLTGLYKTDDDFKQALKDVQSIPEAYAAWKDKAFTSGANLLAYMKFDDEETVELSKLWNYGTCKADQDTRNSQWQTVLTQMNDLEAKIEAANAWFQPALLAVSDEQLDTWYNETESLKLYKLALDRMRALKAHTLEPDEEQLLAQADVLESQPNTIFSMLNDADLSFPDVKDSEGNTHHVTHGSFVPLLEKSPDRTLRENAFHSVYGVYGSVKNTAAAVLTAQMQTLKFFAQARHYSNSLEASLTPTEVPVEVYDNLINSVHNRIQPLHDYVELRKRVMGVDHLHYWDIYTPLVPDINRRYSYEEACELMYKALTPLGEDYVNTVKHGVASRWIDVFETPGKHSGAYSADGSGTNPLILLNFQGTLEDVSTLCHEMGHSMQTWLSHKNQPARYRNYAMFVAEVASTTNECLLTHYLLNQTDDKAERTYLINEFCENFKSSLYRQTLFAEFERDINKACANNEGTGAEDMNRLYAKLNEFYYGPTFEDSSEIELEWARIPHFYYNYYVYVYATSFAAAVALSNRILTEGKPAVDDYLNFLSGGCSKTPIELLRGAGVDMTSGEAVDSALEEFDKLVKELNKLL